MLTAYEFVGWELVPKAGVEPARAQGPLDFESSASACSATSAQSRK